MRKAGFLWAIALLVLALLLGSLLLASPAIILGTAIYGEVFGDPVDPAAAQK